MVYGEKNCLSQDEGSNINVMTIALKFVFNCEYLWLKKSF
jgi:hypothetical protein